MNNKPRQSRGRGRKMGRTNDQYFLILKRFTERREGSSAVRCFHNVCEGLNSNPIIQGL